MHQQDQIARIQQRQVEVRKFVAEQRELTQSATLEPWQLVFVGMIAGAALVGAGAAFIRFVG